jgi:hypothetical protein
MTPSAYVEGGITFALGRKPWAGNGQDPPNATCLRNGRPPSFDWRSEEGAWVLGLRNLSRVLR